MVKLIASICLACAFSVQVFAQNNYEAFKKELDAKLELLSLFPHKIYEEEYSEVGEFDPDSLSMVIAGELAAYIQNNGFQNIDIEDMPQIDYYISENDSTFRVYTVGYDSGGSARWIPHPVIVKQDGEKLKVFDLSYIECNFYDFYKLKDEVYLCIGYIPGWGACINQAIYAIDFGGEKAEFVPVFNGKEDLSICNSDIYYDRSHGILTIDVNHLSLNNENENCQTFFDRYYDGFSSFSPECYTVSFHSQEEMAVVLTSVFDGEKFVKPESMADR